MAGLEPAIQGQMLEVLILLLWMGGSSPPMEG